MVALTREQFLSQKRDYSDYLIHLTRSQNGLSAATVLAHILLSHEVKAMHSHCLFTPWLEGSPHLEPGFSVACFSESPLEFIGDLVSQVEGRYFQLEPYGVAVRKDTVVEKGGNPALYVNRSLATRFQGIWRMLIQQNDLDTLRESMPFVSLMEKGHYDFHWEREWRVPGGLPIAPQNVSFIVCSEQHIEWLKNYLDFYQPSFWRDVPIVDAAWRPGRIVEEVAGRRV